MKDYRTWWRRAHDVEFELFHHQDGRIQIYPGDFSADDIDCALEQMWAIREGLSENPEGRG